MIKLQNTANLQKFILSLILLAVAACGTPPTATNYHDPGMDFASLRTIAVMPFENLSRDNRGSERVRETFANSLLSTGALYVIPPGEVARGISRAGILRPATPSLEEIVKFTGIVKVDAVITGVVTEYGQIRSGNASANVVSLNVQMIEIQSRKVVWTASSTKGGISMWDRLLGAGGRPMNDVTQAAVNDLIDKLFQQ